MRLIVFWGRRGIRFYNAPVKATVITTILPGTQKENNQITGCYCMRIYKIESPICEKKSPFFEWVEPRTFRRINSIVLPLFGYFFTNRIEIYRSFFINIRSSSVYGMGTTLLASVRAFRPLCTGAPRVAPMPDWSVNF